MRCSPFTAVYDACVLYPAPLRDFLMELALTGSFRARWSREIHDEWQRNLLRNRPDLSAERLTRTVRLMNEAIPDSVVSGHLPLIDGLVLPDPGDRHVLAAAIRCNASVIVTFNQKDFPQTALDPFGIEAQHPDEFIDNLFNLDPGVVLTAARRQRARFRQPPMKADHYLSVLLRQGLVQTTKNLVGFRAVL
ncbi:putative toxin-antitoxin system toxin component, PIN family [Cupriavidus sp. 2KB_3]|uniref:PIN domain-containing protein n=1 Tax=Cupriavidus TaxID=106589 RepID=UPI0011EC3825|nr:PIN domain-containing protein [Cupriavidus campinensis]